MKVEVDFMTKIEMLEAILEEPAIRSNAEYVDFLEKEIATLKTRQAIAKKRTSDKQATLEPVRKAIVDFLQADGRELRIGDLKESIPELAAFSTQKISAMLTQLVNNGDVIRTYEKRIAYFAYNNKVE